MFVYKVTNITNGKSYIGITKFAISRRWKRHVRHAERCDTNNRALHSAIRKWGQDNFSVVHFGSARNWEDLLAFERIAIAQEGTRSPHGYNLTDGGDGVRKLTHSDASRAKMSASQKIRFQRPEEITKLKEFAIGRIVSAETRAKMSAKRKGVSRPEHATKAMLAASRLYVMTPEHREKFMNAPRPSPGNRTGVPVTEEARAKMRAAAAARRLLGIPGNRKGAKMPARRVTPQNEVIA